MGQAEKDPGSASNVLQAIGQTPKVVGYPNPSYNKTQYVFLERYMYLIKENPCCGEKIWWQLCFTAKNVYRYCKIVK